MFLITEEIRSSHIQTSGVFNVSIRAWEISLRPAEWPGLTVRNTLIYCRNMDWTSSTGQNQLTSITAEEKISIFCGNQENTLILALYLFCELYCGLSTECMAKFTFWLHWLFWRWWQMFLFIYLYVWSKYIIRTPTLWFYWLKWNCTLETLWKRKLFEFSLCLASVFPMPVIWSSFPWLIIMFTCSLSHYFSFLFKTWVCVMLVVSLFSWELC